MFLINPGSTVTTSANGWTNTYETALKNAMAWLLNMEKQHITGVFIVASDGPNAQGMWVFTFRHNVTGKTALLEIHGIDNLDAYLKQNVFHPRVYWNGSSSGEPKLTDFLRQGYEICIRQKETQ